MKRIYTRTGDKGQTAIHGGERVSKTNVRIEANGQLDELNVAVGIVRSMLPAGHEWQTALRNIQMTVMPLMSLVATPSERRGENPNTLSETLTEDVERLIDKITAECGETEYFILPGGTPAAAFLHQARVVTRRAERRLLALNEIDPVPEEILKYVNRLSDLFFIMARYEMYNAGIDEELWKSFTYKRNIGK